VFALTVAVLGSVSAVAPVRADDKPMAKPGAAASGRSPQDVYRELYGAEHDAASKASASPAEKLKFARKLAEAADLAEADPALAKLLRERAVEFASADKAGYVFALEQLRAIPSDKADKAAGAERAGRLEQAAGLLEKIVRAEKPPAKAQRAQELADTYRELAREHSARREFDAALKALEKARAAVRTFLPASKETKELSAEIDRDAEAASAAQKVHAKVEAARQTLKAKPDDPAANAVVGIDTLVSGEDPAAAAPFLAKAADPAIKKLAEVAGRTEPADLEAADALKAAGQVPSARDWQAALYAAAAKRYQAVMEKQPDHPEAVRIRLVLKQIVPAVPDKPSGGTSSTPSPTPSTSKTPAAPGKPLKAVRAYFLGDLRTETIRPKSIAELAKARGQDFVFGRQTIAPLSWLWSHPDDGATEEPFGKHRSALAQHEWDVLVLQPADRMLEGDDESDLPVCKRFAESALKKSPNVQVAVLSCWPSREDKNGAVEKIDFPARWNREFNGGWGGRTFETRDYYEKLAAGLRKSVPQLKRPVIVIPVGDVMMELDKRAKAGKVPGLKDADQLYRDKVQLSDVGAYAAACTVYATLLRTSPVGLPAEPYGLTDAKLARAVQEAAWDVVRTHPSAGVGK
jgi:tetratricopeptide (TPR) repeat protein